MFNPDFGINSILFQRGIYPPESFRTEEHFGLSILVSTDEKIQQFLEPVLNQMKGNIYSFIFNGNCFTIKYVQIKLIECYKIRK